MKVSDLIGALIVIPGDTDVTIDAEWGQQDLEHVYLDKLNGSVVFTSYGSSRFKELI